MNLYATLPALKAQLGITDSAQDANLLFTLEAASRAIDGQCSRNFYVVNEMRSFGATNERQILVDDLLSVSLIAEDGDGSGEFADEWTADDYYLYPHNGYPKWSICAHPVSARRFTVGDEAVIEVTGLWGHGDGLSASPFKASGVSVTCDADDASITMQNTALQTGHTILVDDEQMYVSAASSAAIELVRGVNGTTPEAHASSPAKIAQYPNDLSQLCLIWAARFRSEVKTAGMAGETFGNYSYRIQASRTATEEMILANYRRAYA